MKFEEAVQVAENMKRKFPREVFLALPPTWLIYTIAGSVIFEDSKSNEGVALFTIDNSPEQTFGTIFLDIYVLNASQPSSSR